MMHEPEKSDPSTVAARPANKSKGLEAEWVERREGAEGNTSSDRTHRTLSRVSMSSGLERVRERANLRVTGKACQYVDVTGRTRGHTNNLIFKSCWFRGPSLTECA
jgi:hypothetical protein